MNILRSTHEIWNLKCLDFPPLSTYKATQNEVDIMYLKSVVDEGLQHFQDEKFMRCEYEILSRIVYRMKGKFRTSKDFKSLEKVKQTLRNYYCIKIVSYLENFRGLIPVKSEDNEIYLPTKNTVDYLLVRLQGMVKLLERIVTTTKLTANLFYVRLRIGHFWKLGLLVFALISRIYVLAKHHTKFLCDMYAKLYPFSCKLKNINSYGWLPKDYNLPKNLREWLQVDWIDKDNDIIEILELPRTIDFFNVIDDEDDIEFCNEYILIKDDREPDDIINRFRNLPKITDANILFRGFGIDGDIGEVVEINDTILEDNADEMDNEQTDSENDVDKVISLSDSDNSVEEVGEEISNTQAINNNVNNISCFISLDDKSLLSNKTSSVMQKQGKKRKRNRKLNTPEKIVKVTHDDSVTIIEGNRSKSNNEQKTNSLDDSVVIVNESDGISDIKQSKKRKLKARQNFQNSDKAVTSRKNAFKQKSSLSSSLNLSCKQKHTKNQGKKGKKKKANHRDRYFGYKNNLVN